MSELVVHEPLASEIRDAARAEGMDAESLLAAALRHYRFQAQRNKVDDESRWWRDAPGEMRAKYAGEHVAIHSHAVVDHDRDEDVLRRRIRAHYGKTAVLITRADGPGELRFVSTRLEGA